MSKPSIVTSKPYKDKLRFAISLVIATFMSNFIFPELGIVRGGLMFTKDYNLRNGLIHGLSIFVVLGIVYWLLGTFPFFKKEIIPPSTSQDSV